MLWCFGVRKCPGLRETLLDEGVESGLHIGGADEERRFENFEDELTGIGRVAPVDFDAVFGCGAGVAGDFDACGFGFLAQRCEVVRAMPEKTCG